MDADALSLLQDDVAEIRRRGIDDHRRADPARSFQTLVVANRARDDGLDSLGDEQLQTQQPDRTWPGDQRRLADPHSGNFGDGLNRRREGLAESSLLQREIVRHTIQLVRSRDHVAREATVYSVSHPAARFAEDEVARAAVHAATAREGRRAENRDPVSDID